MKRVEFIPGKQDQKKRAERNEGIRKEILEFIESGYECCVLETCEYKFHKDPETGKYKWQDTNTRDRIKGVMLDTMATWNREHGTRIRLELCARQGKFYLRRSDDVQ